MKSRLLSLGLLSALLLSACSFFPGGGSKDETTDADTDTTTETSETTTSTAADETPADELTIYDFDDSCSGVAVSSATAYSDAPGTHKVLLFDRDSDTESFYQDSFTLPEQWQVAYDENAAPVELITCVTTLPKEKGESCDYDIEGDTYTAEMYSADFKVELYEAKTGKLVQETSLSMDAPECPSFKYFTSKVEAEYPDYKQPLIDFLKPYVQK